MSKRTGDPVCALVGSACEHHAALWPAELLQSLQGRYGRVMDAAQATAAWGPPKDVEHTVPVRFTRPYQGAAGRCYGGWYRPDELFALDPAMVSERGTR